MVPLIVSEYGFNLEEKSRTEFLTQFLVTYLDSYYSDFF